MYPPRNKGGLEVHGADADAAGDSDEMEEPAMKLQCDLFDFAYVPGGLAAGIHKVFYMFYDIHFHHRRYPFPFVSILVSKCMGEHLFERLARERGIKVEEMWEIISAWIRRGMNDPDPEKRVCTPFDVVLAFFVSVLIVLKFVGEYGEKETRGT